MYVSAHRLRLRLWFPHRRPENVTGPAFLSECDDPYIGGIDRGLEFQVNLLAKVLALLYGPNLLQVTQHRNVCEMASAVFSMQYLRFGVV